MHRALERFGRLKPRSVLEPAIRLATEGFDVTPLLRRQIRWCRASLARCPYAAEVLLDDGAPPPSGRLVRQFLELSGRSFDQLRGWTPIVVNLPPR